MTKTPQFLTCPAFSHRKSLITARSFFIVKNIGLISNPGCDSAVKLGETWDHQTVRFWVPALGLFVGFCEWGNCPKSWAQVESLALMHGLWTNIPCLCWMGNLLGKFSLCGTWLTAAGIHFPGGISVALI